MAYDLLFPLLEASVIIGIIILGLKVLSPLLSRKYTARWKYWIWLILALRLLFPFSLALPAAPVVVPVRDVRIALPAVAPATPPEPVAPAAQAAAAVSTESAARSGSISLWDISGCVWLTGFVTFMAIQFAFYFAYRKRVLRWSRPAEDGRILRRFSELCAAMRVRGRIGVVVSEGIQSPQMIGYFRPLLLLPHENYGADELNHILTHELAHFVRRDLWYKLLLLSANAVHWFNPLCYLMMREAAADLELSCDDIVMRGATFDERKAYSETLLSSIHIGHNRRIALTTDFRGGVETMKKRFHNILTRNKRRTGWMPLAATLALVLLGSMLVGESPGIAQQNPTAMVQESAYASSNSDSYFKELTEIYAPYAQYGLSYDARTGRLYYQGQLVRYFEDMYPVGEGSSSGTVSSQPDGEVDVHAVRDFTKDRFNPDGSVNPAGRLIGIKPYTQAEFDQRTEDRRKAELMRQDALGASNAIPYAVSADDGEVDELDIEWWTYEEYAAWLEKEREELPKIIGERGWTSAEGWFVWTREKVDAALARYEQTLRDIEKGFKVSKTVNGQEDVMIAQSIPADDTIEPVIEYSTEMNESAGNNLSYDKPSAVTGIEAVEAVEDISHSAGTSYVADSTDAILAGSAENAAVQSSFSAVLKLNNGEIVDLGTFDTYVDRYNAVKEFCDARVAKGSMSRAEADGIISKYK